MNKNFDTFLSGMIATNRQLNDYVEWNKVILKTRTIEYKINKLNYLICNSDDELLKRIKIIHKDNYNNFEILPNLIAVREDKLIYKTTDNKIKRKINLKNIKDVVDFIFKSKLNILFTNFKLKNLMDYCYGVEVGLDSNARKNRFGSIMEYIIKKILDNNNIKYKTQPSNKELNILHNDVDKKRYDFSFLINDITYIIECNFYTSGGSKLNETARSYIELENKIKNIKNTKFIWITDGEGWKSAKNKLKAAYLYNEYVFNIKEFKKFIINIK